MSLRRWLSVAAVMAVMAAAAALELEETDYIHTSANRMIQVNTLVTPDSNKISTSITQNQINEMIKFFKLVEQTNKLDIAEIVSAVHFLAKLGKVNITQVNHLVSLVFKIRQVNITEVVKIINGLNQNATTTVKPPNQPGTNSTGSSSNYTTTASSGCTSTPAVVTMSPGDTYTFTSPGFPKSFIPWFSLCKYSFKTASTDDRLLFKCSTKSMSWSSNFEYTSKDVTVKDNCCMFCAGDRPINETLLGSTLEVKFNNGLFATPGYNCTVEAVSQPLTCECGAYTKDKIVGGTEAKPLSYPWMATLMMDQGGNKYSFCGASLITPYWLLTAAHCTKKFSPSQLTVTLGVHKRSNSTATQIKKKVLEKVDHPSYRTGNNNYDFALLRIDGLNLTQHPLIKAICLPEGNDQYVGKAATLAGWGWTSSPSGSLSDVLKEAQITVPSNAKCQEAWSSSLFTTITDQMICAEAPDSKACRGDSGGPMFLKGTAATVIGVASFGPTDCNSKTLPAVYSRVTSQLQWIDSHVKQKCTPVK